MGFSAFLPRLGLSAGSFVLSAEPGGVVDGVMLASFCSFASACPLAVSSGSTVLSVLRHKQADAASVSSIHDLSRMKTVFIGRDQHPVTLMEMVPITAAAWQKKACFDSLRSNACLLVDANHKSADVLNLVMQELLVLCQKILMREQDLL